MAIAFSRSSVALEADRGRIHIVILVVAIGLLSVWCSWFLRGEVVLYETSRSALVEAHRAAHLVDVQVGGRVTAFDLVLGAKVAQGALLLTLGSERLQSERVEHEARLRGLDAQAMQLRAQIAAQERAIRDHVRVGPARIAQAEAERKRADVIAEQAIIEAERATTLEREGAVAESDARRARSEAEGRRAAALAAIAAVGRAAAEQRAQESELTVELARLERESALLAGQSAEQRAVLESLDRRIEEHSIRAPIAGVLGQIASIQIGSVLSEGEQVAAIVPDGSVKVVADYAPEDAVGRIAAGQLARVRLDAFPWTQFGSLAAQVTRVGDVPINGQVRIELEVQPDPSGRIRLEHGLPAAVSVEVERVTPVALALRVAGRWLRRQQP